MSETRRFIKNAFFNVVNGAAGAAFAIALPYFFVREFSSAEFGVWVLVFQVAAYATYLNFGLQVAVGRYVAHAIEVSDQVRAGGIVAAAVHILAALAGIGFLVIAGVAAAFPQIFHQVPGPLMDPARILLLWVGGAVALGLPASAFLGAFAGLQRNEIPGWIGAMGKGVLAAALITTAALTHDLVITGVVYFVVSLATYLLQVFVYQWFCSHWNTNFFRPHSAQVRELVSYCASLVVWVLAMLLINGMDTTIVGLFDFESVASYGIASSIVSLFAGVTQALLSPLIQIFTKLHVREDQNGSMKLLHLSAFSVTLLMLVMATVAVSIAEPAFTLWVGPRLAQKAILLFDILIFANVFRYSLLPFTNYLIATGLQKKVLLSPAAEGIANFLFSVITVRYIGATGVALGTMFGAILTLGINHFHNFPRTAPAGYTVGRIVLWNLGLPILFSSLALAAAGFKILGLITWRVELVLLIAGCGVAAVGAAYAYQKFARPSWHIAETPQPDMPQR